MMFFLLKNRNDIVVALYSLVLIAMVFVSKPEQNYSMVLRLGLLAAVILPIFFSKDYIIFSFACFYAINSTSFCRLLPSDAYYYIILILITFMFSAKKPELINRMLMAFFAITPFLLLSLMYGDAQEFQLWWVVCLLFIPLLESEKQLKLLAFSFPVVSLFLSLLYLLNRSYFIFSYGEVLERSNWINPNQFGGTIAVGIVMGIALLLKQFKIRISKMNSILLLTCVCTSFVVIVLNASRGSFLASTAASLILIFLSDVKSRYKILLVTCLSLFAFVLWQSGFFELLVFRMESDTASTAGSRFLIWSEKLNSFTNAPGFLHYLIGAGGRTGAEVMGHSAGIANMSTHNDFVTAFIGFGVPCFLYFIYLICYPFLHMPKGHERIVFAIITLFVVVECSVLEVMFRGYVTYLMLYLFLYSYCILER